MKNKDSVGSESYFLPARTGKSNLEKESSFTGPTRLGSVSRCVYSTKIRLNSQKKSDYQQRHKNTHGVVLDVVSTQEICHHREMFVRFFFAREEDTKAPENAGIAHNEERRKKKRTEKSSQQNEKS